MTSLTYTKTEMMLITAARRLRNGDHIFVGIGKPNLAANLAKRLHAPELHMIYESGCIDANPSRIPISIGDPALVTGAASVCSMFDVFACYLQRGLIDVGFVEGAQIDRYGNLNTTVIGDYFDPKVRLPGSGGAQDICTLAKRLIVMMPHETRRLVAKVDFITSPGFLGGAAEREALGMPGGGPEVVITDKAILEFDATGEMVLASVHPGVSVDEVIANTGWALKTLPQVPITLEPTEAELRLLREELDPKGYYLK